MKKFSIFNFQFSNSGFSLIELLVVVTMIGLIGTLTTQIFILGIKSQAKSEVIKEVKQNGDYAITVMENMVRNAVDVSNSACNVSQDHLIILNPDGISTTFSCNIFETENKYRKIASVSGTLPETVYALTSEKVNLSSCIFRVVCPDPPLSPKYVFISFTIRGINSSLTPTPGNISSLEYQTTVSLRTYR